METKSILTVGITLFLVFLSYFMVSSTGHKAGNWTLEDIEIYQANATANKMAIENCTKFYHLEAVFQSLNECMISVGNSTAVERLRKRLAMISLVEPTDSQEIWHDEAQSSAANGSLETSRSKEQVRDKRKSHMIGDKEFLPSGLGLRVRVQNPWRIMESKAIQENPCIGQCMLEKKGLIDKSGQPQMDKILSVTLQVLLNGKGTMGDAKQIAQKCVQRYMDRIGKHVKNEGKDSTEKSSGKSNERCKASAKLGICLSMESFQKCYSSFMSSEAPHQQQLKHPESGSDKKGKTVDN